MTHQAFAHPGDHRWETRFLVVIVAVLTVFGLVSVYSAATFGAGAFREALKQLAAALAGAVVLLVAARVDYRKWNGAAWWLLGATVVLLAALLLPGVPVINGSRRWIKLAGIGFQPSELARFSIVVWAATIAAKKGEAIRQFKKGVLPVLLVAGFVATLVLVEPNLSIAMIIGLLSGVVLFAAGARIGQFLLIGVVAVFMTVGAIRAVPYRFVRAKCWLGLATDCATGSGYQLDQATKGFASGRLLGAGFGEGQLKLDYLPYATNDFLFSTIGEEWGFLGVLFVLGLFGLFCWLGLRIARTAPDPFGQYLATGLTASIGLTALMHVAVNVGLMPTTGVTLPFMSAGRSSLLVTLLSVGVVVSVGRMRGRAGPS